MVTLGHDEKVHIRICLNLSIFIIVNVKKLEQIRTIVMVTHVKPQNLSHVSQVHLCCSKTSRLPYQQVV